MAHLHAGFPCFLSVPSLDLGSCPLFSPLFLDLMTPFDEQPALPSQWSCVPLDFGRREALIFLSWPCLWDRAHHLALKPLASLLKLGNTINEMSLLWGFLASTPDFPVSNFPRKPACLRGMQ